MQCYGPDDIALGLTQFKKHLYPDFKTNQNYNEHWIIIFYDSTDVIHYQRIPICSVWSFISSIGGSLGLFLGFSGYSVLSYFINCMKQKTELSSRVNTTYSDEVLLVTHHENENELKVAKMILDLIQPYLIALGVLVIGGYWHQSKKKQM